MRAEMLTRALKKSVFDPTKNEPTGAMSVSYFFKKNKKEVVRGCAIEFWLKVLFLRANKTLILWEEPLNLEKREK